MCSSTPRALRLGVRRVGHGVGAARTIAQDEFDVLACVVAEGVVGGQLQAHLHHVGRFFLQRGHAHRHFLDRKSAFVSDLARLQHHVALRHAAAGQHPASLRLGLAQGLGLVRAVYHLAFELLAFARAAGAVFAAIGQAHARADGGGQQRLARIGRKSAPAGLNGDLEGGGGGRSSGHALGILGGIKHSERGRFCPLHLMVG